MTNRTRSVDAAEDFFGTTVPDPYRWLEDPDDPEVAEWVREQGIRSREYLDGLADLDAMRARLRALVSRPSSGLPVRRGERWFRTRNDGVQQQDVLVVSGEPFGAERVLIDPNPLTEDGSTSLAWFNADPSGRLVAFSYSEAGSDWDTLRVRDVESGTDLPDLVPWSKFTGAHWLGDGSGFFYGAFDAPQGNEYTGANTDHRVMLHRIGTPAEHDEVVLALPSESDVTFSLTVTDDGRWLVVLGNHGTDPATRVWVRDLTGGGEVRAVVDVAADLWWPVGSRGDTLFMQTDQDAPLGRIVGLDARTGTVTEVVAERSDSLQGATLAGQTLALHWLHDVSSQVTLHDVDGTERGRLDLAAPVSVTDLSGRAGEPLLHLATTSFTEPPRVLSYDTAGAELRTVFAPPSPDDADVVAEQIWVASRDGTRIPVFLLHRPEVTVAGGPHPAWLYGYGGFTVAVPPSFEPTRFAFAAAGGVAAVACLRGGGEFGRPWYDAGRLANKQNVFDDAIAVAEHLVAAGWTSAQHLAASGRSNGGLLAGALLTQRPELFACVVPEVGVLDMLRFTLWTIGWAWISDYGDPRADAAQFATLYAYSPLHRLRAGVDYPPVLALTSDHDDRVVPAHSLKFVAALQALEPKLALLRVAASGGHGHGRSHDALITERADVLAFVAEHTGLRWPV